MTQSADKIESHKFHRDKIKSARERERERGRYEENRKGTAKGRSFVRAGGEGGESPPQPLQCSRMGCARAHPYGVVGSSSVILLANYAEYLYPAQLKGGD